MGHLRALLFTILLLCFSKSVSKYNAMWWNWLLTFRLICALCVLCDVICVLCWIFMLYSWIIPLFFFCSSQLRLWVMFDVWCSGHPLTCQIGMGNSKGTKKPQKLLDLVMWLVAHMFVCTILVVRQQFNLPSYSILLLWSLGVCVPP